jgi:3-deoxy-D-manno-octulosonic-acid transferase
MKTGIPGRAVALAYALVGAVATVWGLLCRLGVMGGAQRAVWRERLGDWGAGTPVTEGFVWLHAASVGEVAAARPLLRALRARLPGRFLLVTCNTATGRLAAEGLDCDGVRYFPLDFAPVVRRILRRARPSLFVFVETEIWPTLLGRLKRAQIPTAMVNARVSDGSYPRYLRIAALIGPALAGVDIVCARDEISHERLLTLGAAPDATTLVGDMKLDALAPSLVSGTRDLFADMFAAGADGPLLVAASTRTGEDPLVLDAFERVLKHDGSARLVLAPRHPDRFDAVAALLEERGHAFVRRSNPNARRIYWQVLLLDSVGELRGFFPSATAAFVGGTLVPRGGHNVMEPAAFGVPVVVGPSLENVREQAVALADAGALRVAENERDLAGAWIDWITDSNAREKAGQAGRSCVASGRGAVQEAMERLEPILVGDRRSRAA